MPRTATKPTKQTQLTKHVVYVHGICKHEAGYSNDWWAAMKRYTPDIPDDGKHRHEVLWSQHVTPKLGEEPQPLEPEQATIAENLKAILIDRAQRQLMEAAWETSREEACIEAVGTEVATRVPGIDCIDDFVKYLMIKKVRDAVIKEFADVVGPLLEKRETVEVIAHSWGSVVGYEAMRRMDDSGLSPTVHNFFSVGSPLCCLLIKPWLEKKDGKRPHVVQTWVNLNAKGDIVGGRLKGWFDVNYDYLQLPPVGCFCPPTPGCAHRSYFHRDNRLVNEGIFGKYIKG